MVKTRILRSRAGYLTGFMIELKTGIIMVKLNKIYTRTGDDGTTSLVGGGRVSKHARRPSAFGEVDELNSVLDWQITLSGQ